MIGKISGEDHPFVEHFRFVKQFEEEGIVAKQTIPAPAQLLAELYREDNGEKTKKIYPDDEQLIQDIAAAYRTVIRALYAAGCRNLQLMTVPGACSAMKDIAVSGHSAAIRWKKRHSGICA